MPSSTWRLRSRMRTSAARSSAPTSRLHVRFAGADRAAERDLAVEARVVHAHGRVQRAPIALVPERVATRAVDEREPRRARVREQCDRSTRAPRAMRRRHDGCLCDRACG